MLSMLLATCLHPPSYHTTHRSLTYGHPIRQRQRACSSPINTTPILRVTQQAHLINTQVVAFISQQVRRLPCQLAGSSVHQDLIFIRRGMPRLAALFHHRIVDVSSIAELCFRWYRSDFLRQGRLSHLLRRCWARL